MAYISKITTPNGTTYDIKDTWAHDAIEALTGGQAITFGGVTTTNLTDGGTEKPTVDGTQVNPSKGQLFFKGTKEFLWDGEKWIELGTLDALGDLAYKDSASGSYKPAGTISAPTFTGTSSDVTITATTNTNGNYQPAGTVSKPTFTGNTNTFTGTYTPAGTIATTATTENKTVTVSAASGDATYTPEGTVTAPTISVKTAGATTTIKNPTAVSVVNALAAAAPGAEAPTNAITYYSVTGETLSLYQIGATKTDSITTANVTVKTGDAAYSATAPTFNGTGAHLVTDNIAVPKTYTSTWTGTEATISVSGKPTGTVSQPTFSGTKVQLVGTTTATGTVSAPSFTGTQATITVS